MSDLTSWLEAWGLGNLAETLARQDIGLDDLRLLRAEDIRDLGLPIGPRRRLINAISASFPNAELAPSPPAPAADRADAASGHEAERRQLTIVFIDLAGSTELSTQLDPEEMSAVLRAYQLCCSDAIARFGGRITRFLGDGILASFGFPRAHEDDAERSVLAALAIVREVPRLRPFRDVSLRARVGIATGLVMVGELIGEGESEQFAMVGETPNLAARLQAEAPANSIMISASTQRLTAGLFDAVEVGKRRLKGFAEPVAVWQVRGESRAESRFEALRAREMVPMVGRIDQFALLRGCWRRAVTGTGQVVLISGEAGLGKSRMIRAMREILEPDQPHIIAYYCSPHHQTSALYPVISQIERAAGIVREDSGEEKLAKLERMLLQRGTPLTDAVPLLAALLSIPVSDRCKLTPQSADQLKERTLRLLIHRFGQISADRPLLCLFEDVHWSDPSSLELLERVSGAVETLPIMIAVTTRPTPEPIRFDARADVTRIPLARLGRAEAEQLVLHAAGSRNVPPEIIGEIIARADGVPLFIEELTKTVLETGLLIARSDQQGQHGAAPATIVPATLHDSLMARLDHMSLIKPLAQLAAVLGRVFSLDLLKAVAPAQLQPVETAIAALVAAEIIYPVNAATELYQFKHSLLQDVAYQSLLKATRQRYHESTARTLAERFPEIAEAQPEFVAHHFTEAGLAEPAMRFWLRAGKRAAERSSNLEAIAQLKRGLALLDSVVEPDERGRLEYAFRLALLTPLIAVKGYTSAEIEENYHHALRLAEELGDTEEIFPALNSRQAFEFVIGQIDRALAHAEEAVQLARRNPASGSGAFAGRFLGTIKLFSGDPVAARPLLEHILVIYDDERHRNSALFFGQDHFVASASYLCLAMWHSGFLEQAREYRRLALERARALDHVNTLCLTLTFAGGCFGGLCGDVALLEASSIELMELGTTHSLPVWTSAAMALKGKLLLDQGRIADGISQLRAGIAALAKIRIELLRPMFTAWLAAAYVRTGQAREALLALDDGWRVAGNGEHWMDSELHRLSGEIKLLGPERDEAAAEASLREGLAVARRQHSRTFELRSAISLARLWRRQQRAEDARAMVRPILDGFVEGRDSGDVRAAEELLAELASG